MAIVDRRDPATIAMNQNVRANSAVERAGSRPRPVIQQNPAPPAGQAQSEPPAANVTTRLGTETGPMARPKTGFQAWSDHNLGYALANREKVSSRRGRWRGQTTEDTINRFSATAEDRYAALSPAEKEKWSSRANGDHLTTPGEREDLKRYESSVYGSSGGSSPAPSANSGQLAKSATPTKTQSEDQGGEADGTDQNLGAVAIEPLDPESPEGMDMESASQAPQSRPMSQPETPQFASPTQTRSTSSSGATSTAATSSGPSPEDYQNAASAARISAKFRKPKTPYSKRSLAGRVNERIGQLYSTAS